MDTIKIDSKQVKMVAHRGLSGLERENTAPAFVAAGNRSYFGVETDAHVTRDGQFVIIHDETTDRVSEGKVSFNVEESDSAVLRNIVLPDKDSSWNRQDIRIPFLVDYINICKKYDKVCVLELKNAFAREDIVRLVEEITALGYLEQMIFISFSWFNCVTLKELLPCSKVQWLTAEPLKEERIEEMVALKMDLDILHTLVTAELVADLHARGIVINCWTCDDKARGEELVAMGVDYITSNILE